MYCHLHRRFTFTLIKSASEIVVIGRRIKKCAGVKGSVSPLNFKHRGREFRQHSIWHKSVDSSSYVVKELPRTRLRWNPPPKFRQSSGQTVEVLIYNLTCHLPVDTVLCRSCIEERENLFQLLIATNEIGTIICENVKWFPSSGYESTQRRKKYSCRLQIYCLCAEANEYCYPALVWLGTTAFPGFDK